MKTTRNTAKADANAARRPPRQPRMRDVAELAKVSLGTVSRVINDNRTVAEPIRRRVLDAAQQLGFVPDAIARSLRTQATRVIGCLVPDVANPLYAEIVGAAEAVLRASGYNLVLASSRFRHETELNILDVFRSRRLDGLIAAVTRDTDEKTIAAIKNLNFPIVLIERNMPHSSDCVVTDHASGMRQATDYLLALGHKRIGVLTAPETILTGRERAAGFRAAHEAAKIPLDPNIAVYDSFEDTLAYDVAYAMLMSSTPPTAIVAGASEMIGVLKAAQVLGLSVPRDLSVIVIGDTTLAELHSPPLTAVRWDVGRVGLIAAQLLLGKLSNTPTSESRRIALPTELLIRHSCTTPGSPRARRN
jgi:LacI family transcriptional regulator